MIAKDMKLIYKKRNVKLMEGKQMGKYKYILICPDGETCDSFEEYGDDNYEGTFSSNSSAEEATLYSIGCMR